MQKINFRNGSLVFLFIMILLVIALLAGKITYSFLGPDFDEEVIQQGEVTASGDTLIFTKGNNLTLSATTDSFGTGDGNMSDTTNPSVRLVASNKTNEASATYQIGVYINDNTYQYSTEAKTAELILTVKDEKGNLVTSSVDNLKYVTVNGISGFDITESIGAFNIVTDKPITTNNSSSGTTHTWTFVLTFVNLETDQSINENASLKIETIIQKERLQPVLIADYIQKSFTTNGVNGLYLHDSNLTNSANDGSYRYSGGDYELTSKAINEGYSKILSSSTTETGNLINFYCNNNKSYVGASCSASYTHYYTLSYDTASTQYDSYDAVLEKGVVDGYLTKDNIKNFVCFGSEEETCPVDNLYRIIGVFDNKVKLIKYDYATKELLGEDGDFYQRLETTYYSGRKEGNPQVVDRYYWNHEGTKEVNGTNYRNAWSISKLNKVNLNTNYLNNIGEKWQDMITEVTYKVGGNHYNVISYTTVKVAYQNEIINPNTDVEENYKARIGLMYVSDYGYATKPENWTKQLGNNSAEDYRTIKESNWMYMGYMDWTILRVSSYADSAFRVNHVGAVVTNSVYITGNASGVRPVFYLKSSVMLKGGEGTESKPYIID